MSLRDEHASAPTVGAHLRAATMPLTAGLVVPILLARQDAHWGAARLAVGALLAASGWAIVVWTVVLFSRRGRGTLAPWNPTNALVIEGPFSHVRNPMISGVAAAAAGVAIAAGSWRAGAWAVGFVVVNHIYFIALEEPGLRRRFGEPYIAYARAVPRWLPRLRRYVGSEAANGSRSNSGLTRGR
ncbi:MAG: isoprenylcysteine carboxylmethyltransferase family protein [Polyangiaceae bacterium]